MLSDQCVCDVMLYVRCILRGAIRIDRRPVIT